MNVLIDIVHPAQVHFFRPIGQRLEARGHTVTIASRDKDVTLALLERLGAGHCCLSKAGAGMAGLGKEWWVRTCRLMRLARERGADVMVAQTGMTIGVAGVLLGISRVVLEEAEHARLQRLLGLPLANRILTGTGYLGRHGRRQRQFRGVWVQSYLDPRYFTPEAAPLKQAGIDVDRPYIVLRTVSWAAAHDIGHAGPDVDALRRAITELERFGRVILSAEGPVPRELASYANPVPWEHMHHLLAFAALYIGEGGTMAAEAAVLGTPAVFCSPLRCGYLLALENDYGLLYNHNCLADGVTRVRELLSQRDLRSKWQQRRERLLAASDDIPAVFVEEIERAGRQRRIGVR